MARYAQAEEEAALRLDGIRRLKRKRPKTHRKAAEMAERA
jgi:hypothetical protein